MESHSSTDSKQEEHRVRFVGVDWSEEEAKAQRRKQVRSRRQAKIQRQKEEEDSKLREIVASAEPCKQFLVFTVDKTCSEIFKLDFAGVVIEFARIKKQASSDQLIPDSNVQLIQGLLDHHWEEIAGEAQPILYVIEKWMKASISAGIYRAHKDEEAVRDGEIVPRNEMEAAVRDTGIEPPTKLEHFLLRGEHLVDDKKNPPRSTTKEEESAGSSPSRLSYSVASDAPQMEAEGKKKFLSVLRNLNIHEVLAAYVESNKTDAKTSNAQVKRTLKLTRSLFFDPTPTTTSDQFGQNLAYTKEWLEKTARTMKERDLLACLAAVLNEAMARYTSLGEGSTAILSEDKKHA